MILKSSEELRARLTIAAQEDAEAFNCVLEALKMPKNTDKEIEHRALALQKALKYAALKPMEVVEMCLGILNLAWDLHDKSDPYTISDIGVGALMANAGLEGAILNVRINLSLIKDNVFIEEINSRVDKLRKDGNKIFRNIMANVSLYN